MKTKTFTVLFFLLATTVFAQLEKEVEKEKKWALSINVNTVEPLSDAGFDYNVLSERILINGHRKDNSYCVGLNLTYKIIENCGIRLSAKMTNYKVTETRDEREFSPQGNDFGLDSVDANQSMFYFSPGILWNSNYKKLNFYGGFQFVYRQYSAGVGNTRSYIYSGSNSTPFFYTKVYQTEPGGFSIGIGPIAGFSVNVFKSISIGTEFSTAYSYYKTGGAITSFKTNILPTYVTGDPSISGQTFKGFKFSSLLSTINISISF